MHDYQATMRKASHLEISIVSTVVCNIFSSKCKACEKIRSNERDCAKESNFIEIWLIQRKKISNKHVLSSIRPKWLADEMASAVLDSIISHTEQTSEEMKPLSLENPLWCQHWGSDAISTVLTWISSGLAASLQWSHRTHCKTRTSSLNAWWVGATWKVVLRS